MYVHELHTYLVPKQARRRCLQGVMSYEVGAGNQSGASTSTLNHRVISPLFFQSGPICPFRKPKLTFFLLISKSVFGRKPII